MAGKGIAYDKEFPRCLDMVVKRYQEVARNPENSTFSLHTYCTQGETQSVAFARMVQETFPDSKGVVLLCLGVGLPCLLVGSIIYIYIYIEREREREISI